MTDEAEPLAQRSLVYAVVLKGGISSPGWVCEIEYNKNLSYNINYIKKVFSVLVLSRVIALIFSTLSAGYRGTMRLPGWR